MIRIPVADMPPTMEPEKKRRLGDTWRAPRCQALPRLPPAPRLCGIPCFPAWHCADAKPRHFLFASTLEPFSTVYVPMHLLVGPANFIGDLIGMHVLVACFSKRGGSGLQDQATARIRINVSNRRIADFVGPTSTSASRRPEVKQRWKVPVGDLQRRKLDWNQ